LDRGGGSIVLLTTEEYQELLKKAVKTDKLATENTELEQKNYRLTLENELLAQEVQVLREAVEQLSHPFASCPGCDKFRSELAIVTASRDVWQDVAKKYKRVLTGHPASSSPKGGS